MHECMFAYVHVPIGVYKHACGWCNTIAPITWPSNFQILFCGFGRK